jgi:RimJ/RimL family protein N-acetyltransferase
MDGETGFTLREFRTTDIPALVEIGNKTFPDTTTTVEQEEHWEKTYPEGNPRLRFTVETTGGEIVGSGSCMYPFWMNDLGVYSIYAQVDPAWRRRGIGQALFAQLEPYGWQQGAKKLWTDCREDHADSIRFLEAAGYRSYGVRFEQTLDLMQFDSERYSNIFSRVAQAGYMLTTYADECKLRPDAERALYDLYRLTMADVPLPGGAIIEVQYDTWRNFMIDSPTIDPAFIFLARHADELVGLTVIELPKEGPAQTSSTGILREHRGKGVGMALKVMSFQALKARGYKEARTQNDTVNPAILHLNEKLGYRRLPGWLQYEKHAP